MNITTVAVASVMTVMTIASLVAMVSVMTVMTIASLSMMVKPKPLVDDVKPQGEALNGIVGTVSILSIVSRVRAMPRRGERGRHQGAAAGSMLTCCRDRRAVGRGAKQLGNKPHTHTRRLPSQAACRQDRRQAVWRLGSTVRASCHSTRATAKHCAADGAPVPRG